MPVDTHARALAALHGTYVPSLVALAVTGLYFYLSPKDQPMPGRVIASVHGLSIAVLYTAAIALFWSGHSTSRAALPFFIACLMPVALIVASFFYFRGPRLLHFLHIVNVICLLWVAFVGSMAVTDDWF